MIQTDQLTFRYRGGFTLGPVSLSLGAGIHHLQGINGSGKTTLMRLLCGGLRPRRGTVRICGGDPRDHRVRRQVAWMPAECDLPDFLTIEEAWQSTAALRGQPGWSGAAIQDALRVPGRLRIGRASAGQRQKAALLSVLAADPAVLLLDEPLANLDADAAAVLPALLPADRCVLITAHAPLPFPTTSQATLHPGQPLVWSSGGGVG